MTAVLPKGHDWTQTVRYTEGHMVDSPRLWTCHDCDRPIPAGARFYRRLDIRQNNPMICLPCHERIEHERYRHATPACAGCGEPLYWLADSWHHEDGSIWRVREVPCRHCAGQGCRLCLNKGTQQERDHEAAP